MEAYAERYPGRLSGGQQQRVALARALVIRPDLLLLDEPLSALDLKLREEMREEIHRITRELGITTIFVTHDQGEALVLSDRIAVMNQGTIEQLDRPEVLYRSPATPFVADFIGGSNVLEGSIEVTPDGPVFRCGDVTLFPVGHATAPGGRCAISIRPEDIRIVPESEPGGVPGRIERRRFLGSTIEYAIRLTGDLSVTVREHREGGPREGDRVGVAIPTERVVFLAPSSEVAAGKS
jgi:putative spermidine/putrescine transport system ATP-binding protein